MNSDNVAAGGPFTPTGYARRAAYPTAGDAGVSRALTADAGQAAVKAGPDLGALKDNAVTFLNGERKTLAWFDILILTAILWGEAIWTSTEYYLMMVTGEITLAESMGYSNSAADTYTTLFLQVLYLFAALLYLWARGFDFRILNFKVTPKGIAFGCLIFLASAFLCDVCDFALSGVFEVLPIPEPVFALLADVGPADVLYAAFNGFYEEFYFLGLCFSVSSRDFKWVLPFSILVRTSFHTYQGMLNALCIGVAFGLFMVILYYRDDDKNLFPYALGHGIADIFGLSIVQFFL
ncbi:MAG: hypothetical protein IJH61_03780 [Eubacteriaceae bacterium]|nr:hypothetical protein [Eubacteriaceae bacterium]